MAQKILLIDPEQCTGCRICELACSAHHDRVFSPARSRVHIIKWDEMGLDIPMVCQQCDKPVCADVCPIGACYRDEKTGAVMINYDICIGCRMCVYACPFGGTSIDPDKRRIVKCDLCAGDPQCAKYCPTKALQYVKADRVALLKKRIGAEKIAKLMEQIIVVGGR